MVVYSRHVIFESAIAAQRGAIALIERKKDIMQLHQATGKTVQLSHEHKKGCSRYYKSRGTLCLGEFLE